MKKGLGLKENIMKYFSFSAIILLVAGLSLTQENFLGRMNMTNLFRDTAPLMIMSAGMTSVLIFGSIDLSTGAMCSVSNVLFVKFLAQWGAQLPLAVAIPCAFLISIVFGLIAGFLMGMVHVKLKVPSFIASLGFMSVWQSTALLISEAPLSIPKVMWPAVDWFRISYGVIGLPLILALLITVAVYIFQSRTVSGKYLYAIGGNERATRIAGAPVDRTKIKVFVLNGLCAALGGVFLAAKLRSCAPTIGDSFTLMVVASCVLGGASLSGGKGSVLGTIIGVFTVALINNGMNFIGVSAYWQNVVFGAFVLIAIAVSSDRSVRGMIVK
ncbi:MAG: ABC transporter permease [Clostridia bacterium]|nr:ABC transporter permease [Clostridia bacterium]